MGLYDGIPQLPPDPVFGLVAQFKADPRPDKFSLILGYYFSEDLTLPLLETVDEIEQALVDQKIKRFYLPIRGDDEYVAEIQKLVFGSSIDPDRICGMQTVGGTSAVYLTARLATHWTDKVAISNPTWLNHRGIFELAGLKVDEYPYYGNRHLQFDQCVEKLKTLPEKSAVLLHTSCHNPTGLDFTQAQWEQVAEVVEKRGLFPILDMAYQGLAGTPDEDAFSARLFFDKGLEFAVTYTCAKNFSIYGERGGAIFIVAPSLKQATIIRTQLIREIRGCYSNPPMHPAQVVKAILKTPNLKQKWLKELEKMRMRIKKIRKDFVEAVVAKDPEGGWEAIGSGHGLFCYSGLSKKEIERLRDEKGFYLAADGRINLTALNEKNLSLFIDALFSVKN